MEMATHRQTSTNQINFKEGFRYGDGNTQTKQALIRSTLKKGFVMEICNTQTQHNLWISFKEEF